MSVNITRATDTTVDIVAQGGFMLPAGLPTTGVTVQTGPVPVTLTYQGLGRFGVFFFLSMFLCFRWKDASDGVCVHHDSISINQSVSSYFFAPCSFLLLMFFTLVGNDLKH